MKKTLIAAALLGAFTASAFAAPSVTLYGRIDTGLVYSKDKLFGALEFSGVQAAQSMSQDSLEMKSGWATGSRWGLAGAEDIGNIKVGFVLENGFRGDDGADAQEGRMFGREALVSVSGDYGTIYAGRMLSLASDGGTIGMLGETSAFGDAYGVASMKGSTGSAFARYDNTIAYASPTFEGFSAKAMYSFKADSKEADADDNALAENKAEATRYAAAGLQYKGGAFTGVLTAEHTMWGNANYELDDGIALILGGSYDFGVAKAFAKATYFDNAARFEDMFTVFNPSSNGYKSQPIEGWGAEIGANVPAFGGNFLAAIGYRNAKLVENHDMKDRRWNVALGYTYALSRRTSVYGVAGYAREKQKGGIFLAPMNVTVTSTAKETQAGIGLVHKF